MKSLGIYLHIPFCRSKCLYCDFCSRPGATSDDMEAYVARLCDDLSARAPFCRDHTVDSVFFGGGTPTLLSADQLCRLLDRVGSAYSLAPDAEITAECNPATGSPAFFRSLRSHGFNRLSIGLQSADDAELRALGRIHTFSGFRSTWEQARDAGFDNLNADVMFGIPRQTPASFHSTLERLASLRPDHVSAYALTLEENTPLFRMAPSLPMPDEDAVAQMYRDAVSFLASVGLEQYEISNFARAGYQSRHNRKYWNTEEYLGFGVAAHSDFAGVRSGNGRDVSAYLRGDDIVVERSVPSFAERENEYVMLRMRLADGLDFALFRSRFGHDPDAFVSRLSRFTAGGFVRVTPERCFFTVSGFLVSNAILSEVVSFAKTDGNSAKDLDKPAGIVYNE